MTSKLVIIIATGDDKRRLYSNGLLEPNLNGNTGFSSRNPLYAMNAFH